MGIGDEKNESCQYSLFICTVSVLVDKEMISPTANAKPAGPVIPFRSLFPTPEQRHFLSSPLFLPEKEL